MMATKLNAQVIIKNLQNMHEKSLPPTGARRRMELAYQDWARLQWIIIHPQTARQSTHVRAGAAAIHLSAHLSCPVTRSVARAQPRHLSDGVGGGLGAC